MAEVSLKELLEAGAHFGHQTRRWNPKMNRFIYGARNGIHIIDLTKTADRLKEAQDFIKNVTSSGGSVLFVGTKRQAKAIVKAEAEGAGMPYVIERWLGGMLTNFRTIRSQINRLKKLESQKESGELEANYNKKEQLVYEEEMAKLNHIFGGIKDMDHLPAALFVVDVPKEKIAVSEAAKLGIPVVAITDTNADPDIVDYAIPANDDAIKAIKTITHAIAEAAAEGKSAAGKSESANQKEEE
jgi:small subunit ribosomal protein S2